MAKYRVWHGNGPKYKKISSLAEGIKFFRKNEQHTEDDSGIEQLFDGEWDEWLDEDDQNIHEHIYMYGSKSEYLRVDEDDDDDGFDDDDDVEDDDRDAGEVEDRLMNVIGGNTKVKTSDSDDDNDDDDDGDDDEDFDKDEE